MDRRCAQESMHNASCSMLTGHDEERRGCSWVWACLNKRHSFPRWQVFLLFLLFCSLIFTFVVLPLLLFSRSFIYLLSLIMLFYNTEDGYLDGIVRGYRSGLLSQGHYLNLVQCESLEGSVLFIHDTWWHSLFIVHCLWLDLKLQLTATDYGPLLQYESTTLTTTLLAERLTSLYVQQFRYLRANASQPLAQFLDYITYGYMIDNVILLITGTLHERNTNELLDRCHPLGVFDGMEALTTASTPADLYNSVLVETPLGKDWRKNGIGREEWSETGWYTGMTQKPCFILITVLLNLFCWHDVSWLFWQLYFGQRFGRLEHWNHS